MRGEGAGRNVCFFSFLEMEVFIGRRQMKLFESVRMGVTAREAAERYGINVKRKGMACCPFHEDRHPSMKLDRRYHCFGCQADGDVIDFVSKMFGLTPYEAASKLAVDFGIFVPDQKSSVTRCKTEGSNTEMSTADRPSE
jgi:DNA primase